MNAREAKKKADSDTEERAISWSKVEYKDKAEIAKLSDEAREKAKFEARAKNNANTVNKMSVEAAAQISESANMKRANREWAEAEARAKA